MNTLSKILLFCAFVPAYIFSGAADIAAFKKLVTGNAGAWQSIPNNIQYYIAAAIGDNPTGTELYRIGLREQLGEIANYKEYLDPQIYASHKAFWIGLNKIFCNMQLERLEQRLSRSNNEYLESLPSIQKKNIESLRRMLSLNFKSTADSPAYAASITKKAATDTPKYLDWSREYEEHLKKAATQCCDQLKQGKKMLAKKAILTYACMLNKMTTPIKRFEANEVPLYRHAFLMLRNNPPEKWAGSNLPIKAWHALMDAAPLANTGMLTRFSVSPIWDKLEDNNKKAAIRLTTKLIQDVALLIKQQKSSSHSPSTGKSSSAQRKTSSSQKPVQLRKNSTKTPRDTRKK